MITTKQRAYLRSIANDIPALYQIGKNPVGENNVKTLSDALEARELVKISVLETARNSPRELIDELCACLQCEPVQVIGRKIVIYRESKNGKKIELPKA